MTATSGREEAMLAVEDLLRASGLDPEEPLLRGTPQRVALAFAEFFAGVGVDERLPLRRGDVVPDGLHLACLRGLEFRSICAHHLLPFSGIAHVAYAPVERVVGIGSIVRTLEILSTRPQLQEILADELAAAVHQGSGAAGALVVIEARHSCVADRGPREAASRLVTIAASGSLSAPDLRAEAMAAIRGAC